MWATLGALVVACHGGGKSSTPQPCTGAGCVAVTLSSIAIAPPSATIPAGVQQPFTATASFSDGSTQDVSATVTWATSDQAVASMVATGVARGNQAGDASVTAAFQGISASAQLHVTAAAALSLTLDPASASLAKGTSTACSAWATFTDGSRHDVSASASWSSSDASVASVSGGAITAVGLGSATVSASFSGFSASLPVSVTDAVLTSIDVQPQAPALPLGVDQAFTATGLFADQTQQDLTALVTWSTGDAGVATISPAGLVHPVSPGTTTVTATLGSVSGSVSLTVTPAVPQSIAVTPATASLAAGLTQQLTATVTFSDGTTQDVTAQAAWTSSAGQVASVSSAGLVSALQAGSAVVTATFSTVSSSCAVSVTQATLWALAVSPASATIPAGVQQPFTATATFTDGSTQDVSASATWSTSDQAVASMVTTGIASGNQPGDATVTVTLQGLSASAQIHVTAATPVSLSLDPAATRLAKGTSAACSAWATFTDGSRHDVTASASWSTSSASVATVSGGTITAVGLGTAMVSASFSAVSASLPVSVTNAVLTSIDVQSLASTVPLGVDEAFTAIGHFSDQTQQNVTGQVTWSTADAVVATISPAGLVHPVSPGATTVTAALGGVSGSAGLTVTAAVLQSITVLPNATSFAAGTKATLVAVGTYSDGSTRVLAAGVTWASDDPAISISTAAGQTIASGDHPGTANVTATASGITSPPVTLTVTAATLDSLAIAPSTFTMSAGLTQQLLATGTFSDGSTQDLTAQALWSSSAAQVASVSNAPVSAGLVTAIHAGSATISAVMPGVSATASVSVTGDALLSSIAIQPQATTLALGVDQAFTATGLFADQTQQDLTALVTWSTGDAGVATISPAGLVHPVSPGTTTVTATLGSVSGSVSLTVTPALLQSIAVFPSASAFASGTTVTLVAVGTYSDRTTQTLTAGVTWTSDDPAVSISTVAGQTIASGDQPGTANVTATASGISSPPVALTVTSATLVSLSVTPSTVSMPAGFTQQLTATGTFSDGTTQDLTHQATWSPSAGPVASVSSAGLVTALQAGSAVITATFSTGSSSCNVSVTEARLQGIAVSPASASVARGAAIQFHTTGTYSDASTRDLTAIATWSPSSGPIATVSGGTATGLANGQATISASVGDFSASAQLTVTDPVLRSLALSPASSTIALGSTVHLALVGTYSDASTQNLSASASWASSNRAVASVVAGGDVTAVGGGAATISASFGELNAYAPVTVTAAALVSIDVEPQQPTLPLGFDQAFTATGIYTDGSKVDLTAQVTWATGSSNVATVSPTGMVHPVRLGTTSVSASHGGVTGSTTLTVSSATLVSIDVDPPTASIAKLTSTGLQATGTYSDGSQQDITSSAAWSSSDVTVATVTVAGGTVSVEAMAVGTATVTARFAGISGAASITVTPATLASIAFDVTSISGPAGVDRLLTLTGTLQDGTTQDLTSDPGVIWTTSDSQVASISGGLVNYIAPGTTTVTASLLGFTASTDVTVTDATIVSLAVTPTNATIPIHYKVQFTAIATYSDATTEDVTALATWTSSNSLVAVVSNASNPGLATGTAAGTSTIGAAFNGQSASALLTVTTPTLQSITISPNPFTVAVGGKLQLKATGLFNDGTTLDITQQCVWLSSSKSVAWVSKSGVVTGSKVGNVTITAKKGNKNDRASGSVTP